MTIRTSVLALFSLLAVLSSSPTSARESVQFEDAWNEVRQSFQKLLEEQQMVGGSLWFFQNGQPLAREFHGDADVGEGRRIDENTIFHWGSITKTFTGIAIMQLRDRGLLRLEDPVVDYLPELAAVHNPYGKMDEITIMHLMTHSSGLRNPTWPWGGDEPWHPHEPREWSQLVAMMPYTEILFEPGSRYSYSNPGIIFLGRIIEILSGDNYEVYIDKNIFKPLGMVRSYFDHTPYHLLKYRSNNYDVKDGVPKANGLDFDTGITVSNGGLNSPIPDMVRYLAFLVGDSEFIHEPILARSSLEEMWQSRLPMSDPVVESSGVSRDFMGLTFFVLESDNLRLIGHTGSQKAFFSFFYIDPETHTGVIAAFNSQGVAQDGERRPDARAVLNDLRDLIREKIFPLFR
jgi:CubicO group peptidase (beta-lactamase class C family)